MSKQSDTKGTAEQIETSPTGYGFVPVKPKEQDNGKKSDMKKH
ncbi:hypothetical protein [Bacillus sp. FJAT-27245]|nr:hypothetical protein [Bacillus sp. FJAT-27245]